MKEAEQNITITNAATSELLDVNTIDDRDANDFKNEDRSSPAQYNNPQYDDRQTTEKTKKDDEDTISTGSGSIYGLPPGHISIARAVFLISNSALGAGLMNFPEAYMRCGGIVNAITLQFILLVLIVGAFLILAKCANQFQCATYQDILLFMLGKNFFNFSQICILVYFFGAAITYVIIIGEQLSSVLVLLTGQNGVWYTDKRFLFVAFSVVFLLPLCLPRRLKALSYTSLFSGFGAFFITGIVVSNYFSPRYLNASQHNQAPPHVEPDWKSAFASLPVLCFGYQCHVSSVAVYSELKQRSERKFFGCAFAAMMVCALCYTLCGAFGYATFGHNTKPDILTNYADDDVLADVARFAVLLNIFSSFAIVTFCGRIIVDGIVVKFSRLDVYAAERSEKRRRVVITLSWFVLVLVLALVVPNIRVAIDLISGVASLFIFTFPGLMLLKSVNLGAPVWSRKDMLTLFVAGIYLVVGMFIFGLVTTLAIQQDITMKQLH